ncbi:hypothetical protein EYD10_13340, partial [Varanus komodoensis]
MGVGLTSGSLGTNMSTEGEPSALIRVIQLFILSTTWGMQIWVTFIAGFVLFRSVSRHTFGLVQSKLFPFYFYTLLGCTFLNLAIFASYHPWELLNTMETVQPLLVIHMGTNDIAWQGVVRITRDEDLRQAGKRRVAEVNDWLRVWCQKERFGFLYYGTQFLANGLLARDRRGRKDSCEEGADIREDGRMEEDGDSKERKLWERVEIIFFFTGLLLAAANAFWFSQVTTKTMFKMQEIEREHGLGNEMGFSGQREAYQLLKEKDAKYRSLRLKFFKFHGLSSLCNVACVICTGVNLACIALHLDS